MNHTDMQGHHFGCATVMQIIEDGLQSRGAVITARLDGKQDWRTAPGSLAALAGCDSIVVNGEGTLHHGRKKAGWLMAISSHPVTRDKELSLINALYQDNPASWAPLLARFTHLYARDSRSAAAMSRHAGRPVPFFGDLSTASPLVLPPKRRQGFIVGDSVDALVTRALANLAHDPEINDTISLVPLTISLREPNPYRPRILREFRRVSVAVRQARLARKYPRLTYLNDKTAYLGALSSARLSVTGRFHGVCLSLITATPFICLSSNSWKIEALFEDAGIDPRRLVKPAQLSPDLLLQDWQYDAQEAANIDRFLASSRRAAAAMFDAIVGN